MHLELAADFCPETRFADAGKEATLDSSGGCATAN